jgi:hypothetical protein
MTRENGVFKTYGLLPDITRPLPLGTRLTYKVPGTNGEIKTAVVVQAGYISIVVWNDDNTLAIIGYVDIVSVG